MVVALLSEKLRHLPPFLFSIRNWEGPKASPDMAKVKPTVPDSYRTQVRLIVGRFLQSRKRRNNEASCYVLVPFFCFYHSDVQKFLPVTSTFCSPHPIMWKGVPHIRMKVLNVRGLCFVKICRDLDSRRSVDRLGTERH